MAVAFALASSPGFANSDAPKPHNLKSIMTADCHYAEEVMEDPDRQYYAPIDRACEIIEDNNLLEKPVSSEGYRLTAQFLTSFHAAKSTWNAVHLKAWKEALASGEPSSATVGRVNNTGNFLFLYISDVFEAAKTLVNEVGAGKPYQVEDHNGSRFTEDELRRLEQMNPNLSLLNPTLNSMRPA
jgi:hypothetical protein